MKTLNRTSGFSTGKQYFFSTIVLFIFIYILYNIQAYIGYETVSLLLLLIIFLLPLFNFDTGPIILSAVISALAWDYYFIPPHFTMHIAKTEDAVMLFMFFIVAVVNGVLTSKLKSQKNLMAAKERKSDALYRVVKDLSRSKDLNDVLRITVDHISTVFGAESVIFFTDDGNKLMEEPHSASNFVPDETEWLAAETSFKSKTVAGKTTDIMQDAGAIYFPFQINRSVLCVMGVRINDSMKSNRAEMDFLRSIIKEIYPFMERYLVYSNP